MGTTIDGLVQELQKTVMICDSVYAYDRKKYVDECIDIMRKYQKIEDIYYHQTGRALEDSLRSVIEDGNVEVVKE